jgi:hypothetical protein
MTDHSEGDKGKEAVMDFQVSWVLRMAADEDYTKEKPIFRLYSKFMLLKLLDMPIPNPVQIKKVRVWCFKNNILKLYHRYWTHLFKHSSLLVYYR